jgi:iterative type I PKS product template protein
LYHKFYPNTKNISISVDSLVVTKGLVANFNKTPQLIQVTATTMNINSNVADLTWQNINNDGQTQEPFATAKLVFGNASEWLANWAPVAHLIHGRVEALEQLAAQGIANRFSHKMAYTLFASNLVDYSKKYRGIQSVVMHELEGFADVQLTTKESGEWSVPPHFIDSVAHLAGFIMNCSDYNDTKNNFYVTPGWKSMQFAKPLVPGSKYRSYVKMIPTIEDRTIYLGDVYIMQADMIVGKVSGIQFRQYPRILLSRFFSPPDKMAALEGTSTTTSTSTSKPRLTPVSESAVMTSESQSTVFGVGSTTNYEVKPDLSTLTGAMEDLKPTTTTVEIPVAAKSANSITSRAIMLIAKEAGLELSDLEDDANFVELGIDSLLSLVLSEKFKTELDVKVSGSLFLDYPKIGDLTRWLEEYYG